MLLGACSLGFCTEARGATLAHGPPVGWRASLQWDDLAGLEDDAFGRGGGCDDRNIRPNKPDDDRNCVRRAIRPDCVPIGRLTCLTLDSQIQAWPDALSFMHTASQHREPNFISCRVSKAIVGFHGAI
jgi:hypothetical protein